MRFTLTILILTVLVSCSEKTKNRPIKSESKEAKTVELNKVTSDTLNASYPLQIGNDKGSVKIVGIRTFEDEKLTASNFFISLVDVPGISMSKQIDKNVLERLWLKHTINSDYLDSAIIKDVEYSSVRSNTLYFNAILENPIEKKEIIGRFSIFYQTKKKGTVYGWFTDQVKEIMPSKTYEQ